MQTSGPFDGRPVFVFSTPPTPNGDLHLGHLSGPYLGADVFVRFQRLNGVTAWHLTGSDDFQSYVVECARREGRSPAETAAHYSAEIEATLALMDIPLDQYTVTNADPSYPDGLRAFFARLLASGEVAPRADAALFDAVTASYLYEVDVAGICPTCGSGTGGNICEECGEPNNCADLVRPRSGLSDEPPATGTISRFSLPLHRFHGEVVAHHRLGRVPARLRELADRVFRRPRWDVPVSHPADWGVRPAEGGASGVDGQVIWVWPEMAYGFLHGIEALGRRVGADWRAEEPAADWKLVHFFGYDNSFYHSILYPTLYRLAYPDWTPDIDYHVNEFLLLDGAKFSTSRRHAIWGKEILGPHSVDAVRYFLALTRSEGRRTNFRREDYEAVLHDTLIGSWQRWLTDLGARVEKDHGGVAPDAGVWTPEHRGFLTRLRVRLAGATASLGSDGFSLNQAAAELNGIVTDAVRFATGESTVAQVDRWRDETRTAVALELAAARLLADVATPLLPRFAGRLAAALGGHPPTAWPSEVALLPAGTRIDLARQVFFGEPPAAPEPVVTPEPAATPASPNLPWLTELVREALVLPADEPLAGRPLADLGMASLQAVVVQYGVLTTLGVDLSLEDVLGAPDVAALARLLDALVSPPPGPAGPPPMSGAGA